ncbi:MAG: Gx transporter family protein [Eubacterium sp.]|nr:Gx transporter family protein [Eubacterium sp.]
MKNSKAKKAALFGLLVALAFVLSYLESLLPFNLGVPGVKLGLANLVVVVALFTVGEKTALPVAVVRIVLAGLTFGNTYSLVYSLAGGLLSFAVMALVRRRSGLSVFGVSMLGGVTHNIGQIAVAAVLMGTYRIAYYLPVLLVAGLVTGLLIGLAAKPVVNRLQAVLPPDH